MEKYDNIEIYCRKLGHYVPFKYCRTLNNGLPCHKVADCAFEKIPVEDFLKANYTENELKESLTPPPDKLTSIIDLIEKAKNL